MSTTDFSFKSIFAYNGSAYGDDQALKAQSPAGTTFSILGGASHVLYLGSANKFDMAIFDLATLGGSLGVPKWEYTNGAGGWSEFIPSSGSFQTDINDSEGAQYGFDKDGAETFPENRLDDWSTLTVNGENLYWVKVSVPNFSGGTPPTVKRIQMRPLAAYASTKDVFDLMQMSAVLGGSDFHLITTTPTKGTVETFIQEAQSYIDYMTRKSWRPNIVYNEQHSFNLNGFKLDRPDPYKIISLRLWDGADWETKTEGRKDDFFLVRDDGMIYFARYFLLPARFQSYNQPLWRWGGGEFSMPIKVTYLNGRDLNTDVRESGMVNDICKKLAAINITRSADFGGAVVSGMDRVQLAQRLDGWKFEIDEQLESLRAFETF